MDQNLEPSKNIRKMVLLQAPIWEATTNLDVELVKLEHDISCHNEELDKLLERFSNLPKLDSSNQEKPVLPPSEECVPDIEKHYIKNEVGEYVENSLKNKELAQDVYITENTPAPKKVTAKAETLDKSIEMLQQKLKKDEEVFAAMAPNRPWTRCKVVFTFARPTRGLTMKRPLSVKLKVLKDETILVAEKYQIARIQYHKDWLKVTKRVIAGITDTKLLPGIIGAEPHEDNNFRYLVLMDDGTASYFKPTQIYPILWQSALPWEDVQYLNNSNDFAYLRYYFGQYPRRHLLQTQVGEEISLERKDETVTAKVVSLDCDTLRLLYDDNSEESIYLGSPRFLKRNAVVQKQLANHLRSWENYHEDIVNNCHNYHKTAAIALDEDKYHCLHSSDRNLIIDGPTRKNTARKSSSAKSKSPVRITVALDGIDVDENREDVEEVYTTDIARINRQHKCSPDCLRIPNVRTESSLESIFEEFRNVSDIKVPLVLGWKRELVCTISTSKKGETKKKIGIIYKSPCGKLFSQPLNIRRHLANTKSNMDIDYFSFDRDIVLNRDLGDVEAIVFSPNIACDSQGRPLENKYICVMNQFNEERLPVDFEYRSESFAHALLVKKGFTFNEEFKSGCDCEDDCFQRSTCACHQINEDFFGSNLYNRGTVETRCQYKEKRLYEQVATGIFECNSLCKCSSKCPNRVVQNGIRFRLQVRKTLSKGWGVVTLDDIPKGSFICTYAAELLDDADQYGNCDMYYADLDYITVNEERKLGYYEDDERIDEGNETGEESEIDGNSPTPESEDGESPSSQDDLQAQSRYPRRQVQQPQKNKESKKDKEKPEFVKIHTILNSQDFTLDSRIQGNVGRFFNHSCDPNAFVQNVFINTHDLRFPHVAFFSLRTIKATEEITWNYNYKMGCIEGRVIECHCGAPNCRGRIL